MDETNDEEENVNLYDNNDSDDDDDDYDDKDDKDDDAWTGQRHGNENL